MKNTYRFMIAAIVLGGLVGCGGNGKNPSGTGTNNIVVAGGISTTTKTDTPVVPATTTTTGTPTAYTTTVGGVTKTVYIAATPGGATAGTPIAVFPDNIPIINASFTRAPGDVQMTAFSAGGATDVTTTYSNVVSVVNGMLVLNRPIGLVPGEYYGSVEGPLYFAAANGKTLTVGSIGFGFVVDSTGACSFPTIISGTLPANGGNTSDPQFAVTTTSPAKFAGGAASLMINISPTSYVNQGVFLSTQGKATFKSTQGGFAIPSTGVEGIDFRAYGPISE